MANITPGENTSRMLKKAMLRGRRLLKSRSPKVFPDSDIIQASQIDKPIIAIDAMGGDYAPKEIVKGAVRATKELDVRVQLIGPKDILEKELSQYDFDEDDLELIPSAGFIRMDEKQPVSAVKKQRDSSIVVAMKRVAERKADAIVSAGSTGAASTAALLFLKRLAGIERPAIAANLPTAKGDMILLDAGANVDSTAYQMCQHAIMGSVLASVILDLPKPRVGLLNIGEEGGKGNKVSKEAFEILGRLESINFVGNVEGRTLHDHFCDVLVSDGFVGNVMLKTAEGTAKLVFSVMAEELTSSLDIKVGALMCKPAFRRVKNDRLNPAKYGGAILLGVGGVVVIAHGNSNDFAIMNAIRLAAENAKSNILTTIQESLAKEKDLLVYKES